MTDTMIHRVPGFRPRALHSGAPAGIFFPPGGSSFPQGPARTSGLAGRGKASRRTSRQLALPLARSSCRLCGNGQGLCGEGCSSPEMFWGCCMDEGRASRTAIATAYFRAHHYEHANPKIFEDSLAGALLHAEDREPLERFLIAG